MMSFAGVPLSDPDGGEVDVWITENIRPKELFPLAYRYWPGTTLGGPILEVTPEAPRPVRIGTLWWPWGASRFAQAHFVVSESQLATIRNALYTSYTRTRGNFVFDDGETRLTTSMWMLPAWPLATAAAGAGMFLLSLVDDRYWWWGTPLVLTVDDGVTTWLNLYATIGAALGVTIAADSIASAYGTPVTDYSSGYRPLPAVLDAIAFSVGQRIVRGTDGTVKAQNATNALASVTAQLAAANPKYAGGQLALLPGYP